MANPPRAAQIRYSRNVIESALGPRITHYEIPRDKPAIYRWVVGDSSTADDVTVLSHTGGTEGRWIRLRLPVKGEDLGDGAASIGVGGDYLRILPGGTLTGDSVATLNTTNAATGDILTIVRQDLGAYTYQIVNGGPGGAALCTFPVSLAYWADFHFDGTNWELIRGGALPT
ncbi:MAG: hypothetical protein JSV86_07055 [Gemmatimonadota bacterium]|nr:MAG: hypothetical protein JSV86_07055 [Gemmatimonadota bacterium]